MECAEIRSGFVDGRVPEGADVQAHLAGCPHCRVLFEDDALLGRSLAQSTSPAPEAGLLFEAVSRDLAAETGARSKLRSLPTGVRVAALVVVALVLLVWQLLQHRRADLASYSPALFWFIAALLLGALVVGLERLLRGTLTPLDSGVARWTPWLLLALPALAALGVPLGAASDTQGNWGSPGYCFGYGAVLVIPFLVLAWLLERRDALPISALVGAGALAGIAANLLLHAHCSSTHLGHLLLGHASIGVAWALGLGLLAGRLQRSG